MINERRIDSQAIVTDSPREFMLKNICLKWNIEISEELLEKLMTDDDELLRFVQEINK